MAIRIDSIAIGAKLHQLLIFDGTIFIGEYERAQAADIDRKKKEVLNASSLLLKVFHQHKEPFVVRWDSERRTKSIRVNGTEVGTIPREAWERPSWE
jgi:hypothetical protein